MAEKTAEQAHQAARETTAAAQETTERGAEATRRAELAAGMISESVKPLQESARRRRARRPGA